jgi:hypothetical protein
MQPLPDVLPNRRGSLLVVAVVVAIGLFDASVGAFLLLSPTPWIAHGSGTIWLNAPAAAGTDPTTAALLMSLFRRLGAFSFHVGVLTAALGLVGRRDRRVLSLVLALYTVDGLAFLFTDRAYFLGTPYFLMKQFIGAVWAAAVVWHLVEGRRPRA